MSAQATNTIESTIFERTAQLAANTHGYTDLAADHTGVPWEGKRASLSLLIPWQLHIQSHHTIAAICMT